MAKKYHAPKHVQPVEEVVEQPPKVLAIEGRYVPPEHALCESHRPKGKRYAKVYHTKTERYSNSTVVTRYCFCRWCAGSEEYNGNATYKDVQIIKDDTTGIAKQLSDL